MSSDTEVAEAAGHFADVWAELFTSLPDTYGCEMNCPEANAAAALYRALGDEGTADLIIKAHAARDEEGDEHYTAPHRFARGDLVRVVEHDWETLEPAEGGRVLTATVEHEGNAYVQARLVTGPLWAFRQGSGRAATMELSNWRLMPADGDQRG
jgi:hypothetical protein